VLISINQIDSIDAKQAYFFNDEDSGLTLSEENEMWQRMFFGLIFAIVGGFITNVLSSSKEYGILNGIIIFIATAIFGIIGGLVCGFIGFIVFKNSTK